jgi:hypothetical protein
LRSPYLFYRSTNPLLSEHAHDLEVFQNKPFWIWDQQEHYKAFKETEGKCCHVDILGRPQKDGKDYPIFDYQKLIYDAIENNSNVWILKSRGIGLTTFLIYYLTWKILRNHDLDHESIFIVSGTREAHLIVSRKKWLNCLKETFLY